LQHPAGAFERVGERLEPRSIKPASRLVGVTVDQVDRELSQLPDDVRIKASHGVED